MPDSDKIYNRYCHLAIERAKAPPTQQQVAAIEELLGSDLPTSFKEFLQNANGGYIEYVVDVPMKNGKTEEISFCSVYSADPGKFCDETFIGEIHSERKNREIPEGVLPFARDGGGSVVYLDLSSDGKGRVVAFIEGLPEWTGLRTESAFIELAPSFDAYVDLLRINREDLVERLAKDVSELRHVIATEQFLDIGIPSWREDRVLSSAVDEAKRRVTRYPPW